MLKRPHTVLIALSALVYLGSVSFADLNHVHFLSADVPSEHRLYSHDCGAAEIHKSLSHTFQCVTSCRTLNSPFFQPLECISPYLSVEYVSSKDSQPFLDSGVFFPESKRGPPTG